MERNLLVKDAKKRVVQVKKLEKELSAVTDVMKNERNSYASQTTYAIQLRSDMKEKIRTLKAECEVPSGCIGALIVQLMLDPSSVSPGERR